jgi:hypothetical protein
METPELKQQLALDRTKDIQLVLLVSLSLGLFWAIFGKETGRSAQSSTPAIGTVYSEGPVRYRAGRSLEWNDLDGDFPVYERDSIFTPAGSKAAIELSEGGALDLKPNSLVKLIGLGSSGSSVGIVFGEAAHTTNTYDAKAIKQMIYSCAPPRKEVHSLDGPELSALPILPPQGQLLPVRKIAADGLQELTDLKDFILKLVTPADHSDVPRTSLWVDFTWTTIPLPGVRYELEVSRFKDFSTKIGSNRAESGQLLLLNLPGTYYARVSAHLGNQSIQSKINSFNMRKVTRKPSAK